MDLYIPTSQSIIHETSVDFGYRTLPKPVHIVQYDDGLPILKIKTYLNNSIYTIPENAEVNIRLKKKDGTSVYNRALGWNADRTIVYVEITRQMTVAKGHFAPIIEIMIDGKCAGSSCIFLDIDPNPIKDDDIESSDEFGLLQEYIEIIQDLIDSGGTGYILPTASNTTLGGIRIGNNLYIDPETGMVSAVTGSVPIFELDWYDNPTGEQRNANISTLLNIKATVLDNNNKIVAGACRVFIRSEKFYIEAYKVYVSGTGISVYGFDGSDSEITQLYELKLTGTAIYGQSIKILPEDVFDDESGAPASMYAIAQYIDGLLAEKQDTLTAGTGIDITGGTISLNSAAQMSLGKADTAIQLNTARPQDGYIVLSATSFSDGATITLNNWALANLKIYASGCVRSVFLIQSVDSVSHVVSSLELYPIASSFSALPLCAIYDGKLYYVELTENNSVCSGTLSVTSLSGGTAYTAGTGIDITSDVISVDNTIETKPTQISGSNASVAIATLADNTEYRYTDLETLTISAYPQGNFEAWLKLTFASSGTITVTLPTSEYIGSAPTFGNGETWELSIKDGVVVAGRVSA